EPALLTGRSQFPKSARNSGLCPWRSGFWFKQRSLSVSTRGRCPPNLALQKPAYHQQVSDSAKKSIGDAIVRTARNSRMVGNGHLFHRQANVMHEHWHKTV